VRKRDAAPVEVTRFVVSRWFSAGAVVGCAPVGESPSARKLELNAMSVGLSGAWIIGRRYSGVPTPPSSAKATTTQATCHQRRRRSRASKSDREALPSSLVDLTAASARSGAGTSSLHDLASAASGAPHTGHQFSASPGRRFPQQSHLLMPVPTFYSRTSAALLVLSIAARVEMLPKHRSIIARTSAVRQDRGPSGVTILGGRLRCVIQGRQIDISAHQRSHGV